MAENSHLQDAPLPFKVIEEASENLVKNPPHEYYDIINTLPIKSYSPQHLRLYQGFWIPEYFLPGVLTMQNHFQSRPTDLFLASYPKSGTTWLKAQIFAIMTRTEYPLNQHPLLFNNPHQCITFMDKEFALGRSSLVDAIPSPRVLGTHLPYSILPNSITDSCCRIVYIYRDPKDVLVSMYHFKSELEGDRKAHLDDLFAMFCDGSSYFGPIWDHILGYWKKSVERPANVLFLKYEEMLLEPAKHVKKLAEFIGRPFSEAEEKQGFVEKIIELCSFQKLKDLEVNKASFTSAVFDDKYVSRTIFFRKGEVGDWKNHMTSEMAQRIDSILGEKFKGSGLKI